MKTINTHQDLLDCVEKCFDEDGNCFIDLTGKTVQVSNEEQLGYASVMTKDRPN